MAVQLLPGDSQELRKGRGAFFTPPAIADYLAEWAVAGRPDANVLDPTCGESVFLLAAASQLAQAGASPAAMLSQLHGVDFHGSSLRESQRLLGDNGFGATLVEGDFFAEPTPSQLGAQLPWMDAVIGNPPFVRYHAHRGETRKRSAAAALAQGVRLSGLASSWASLLVHATGFLKPSGRVAMVVPAELLTVGYAEPVRRWLLSRFEAVHLVFFERLQFADAEEQVVLLVAWGSGGCEAFTLHQVSDAEDLSTLHVFNATSVTPSEGKWTDLLLPYERRRLFRRVVSEHFAPLASFGSPELGTVTGANRFFAMSEPTRDQYGIDARHLTRIVPPGAKHLRGSTFTRGNWEQLRLKGHRVWLLDPKPTARLVGGLGRYVKEGERLGVPEAYKCSVRTPWWKPPSVPPPDLFFTYMSHHAPRVVANTADVSFVNSLHGLKLGEGTPPYVTEALPLLAYNSVTMLGAELFGRSYGGGILKMEPREAGQLPVPGADALATAWEQLQPDRAKLDELVRASDWRSLSAAVDEALLARTLGLPRHEILALSASAARYRQRRTRRSE
ncbi:MAG: SAM-dependent methyltransferase [Actinomycetota bacterium]|nr:SAM-dependent methyltransferase [Actinomycetota bacterium]MDQ3648400.1 SAM-dependent methyltransferase [Actinomycetota bacterium]